MFHFIRCTFSLLIWIQNWNFFTSINNKREQFHSSRWPESSKKRMICQVSFGHISFPSWKSKSFSVFYCRTGTISFSCFPTNSIRLKNQFWFFRKKAQFYEFSLLKWLFAFVKFHVNIILDLFRTTNFWNQIISEKEKEKNKSKANRLPQILEFVSYFFSIIVNQSIYGSWENV